jgi:hypothetical protein
MKLPCDLARSSGDPINMPVGVRALLQTPLSTVHDLSSCVVDEGITHFYLIDRAVDCVFRVLVLESQREPNINFLVKKKLESATAIALLVGPPCLLQLHNTIFFSR